MDESKRPEDERQVPAGFETWEAYWATQGMPWRTEPEIDELRQQLLAERRAFKPVIEKGLSVLC